MLSIVQGVIAIGVFLYGVLYVLLSVCRAEVRSEGDIIVLLP